jgi:hypothetical protein
MRLIRCLGEQTHRTQNMRELADALRWTMAAVRAAARVESDGAELVPVVEECDGQGLIKAPVGTKRNLRIMLSAMALRYSARGTLHLISSHLNRSRANPIWAQPTTSCISISPTS